MSDLFISGYASRFDEADLSGDIVRRGAFSASLLSRVDPFPMLFGHKTHTPIGVWDRVVEDEEGLFVAGRILDEVGIIIRPLNCDPFLLSMFRRNPLGKQRSSAGFREISIIQMKSIQLLKLKLGGSRARFSLRERPLSCLFNPDLTHSLRSRRLIQWGALGGQEQFKSNVLKLYAFALSKTHG